jgi:hypothetical protein
VIPDNDYDFEEDLKESIDWVLRLKSLIEQVMEIIDIFL